MFPYKNRSVSNLRRNQNNRNGRRKNNQCKIICFFSRVFSHVDSECKINVAGNQITIFIKI